MNGLAQSSQVFGDCRSPQQQSMTTRRPPAAAAVAGAVPYPPSSYASSYPPSPPQYMHHHPSHQQVIRPVSSPPYSCHLLEPLSGKFCWDRFTVAFNWALHRATPGSLRLQALVAYTVQERAKACLDRLNVPPDLEAVSDEEDFSPPHSIATHRKPLRLVLDLDNTLLHACAKAKLDNADIRLADFSADDGSYELYKFTLPLMADQVYYLKLRPGVRRFLQLTSQYCELAVHTNAIREYADAVVAVLDPDRSLFADRVAARDARDTKDIKKDMAKLFNEGSLETRRLLILDDRRDVWGSEFHPNILECGMYDYLDSRRQQLMEKYGGGRTNGLVLSTASVATATPFQDNPLLTEGLSSADEVAEDDDLLTDISNIPMMPTAAAAAVGNPLSAPTPGLSFGPQQSADDQLLDLDFQLEIIAQVIINLAHEFLSKSGDAPDSPLSVAALLQQRRRRILEGAVVQTVGMFKSESCHPEHGWHDNGPLHRRRLQALGATVLDRPEPEQLTHLLAMRATATIDKVRQKRGSKVKYVHALWLHACESTWSAVPEEHFEAMPLLRHYNHNPPKKPWVDHWRILALRQNPNCERVQRAIRQLASAATNVPDDDSKPERTVWVGRPCSHGVRIWSPTERILLKHPSVGGGAMFFEK